MPKIWVRVVPEASTSASMRPSRSAIFLSSVLTSRSTSDASRRRRRAEVPLGRMPRRMRAARSAESVLATPPGRRSRRSPCKRLSARVRSATRSISASRRADAAPPRQLRDRPSSVARCARRPARWPEHRPRRSCGRFRSKAPAPAHRGSLGRHVHHRLAGGRQPYR
jgi:hypothetical protein